MLSPPTSWKLVRDLGPRWVAMRAYVELQRRSGMLKRRLPISGWNFSDAEPAFDLKPSEFFFSADSLPHPRSPELVCVAADRLLAGEWLFFSHQWIRTGFPPDWHRNWLNGKVVEASRHWSEIELDGIHDVKFVWEPSRLTGVYLLVRAYAVARDERYAEAFWRLVEDWAEHNRPNAGVNWASGQELAFRVMAWCFGLHAFANSASTSSRRISRLVRMIEVHGERIAGFIHYALAQQNNHGISEAVVLFTIGALFPHLARAEEWKRRGRELLIRQLREQVYADGSYIQHSFNYQRLMMDVVVWALRIGEVKRCPLPFECYELLKRSTLFLRRFCDAKTGRMPNYGSNDGALILPLTSADYTDYRPSIAGALATVGAETDFAPGDWQEQLQWLGIASRPKVPILERLAVADSQALAGDHESGYVRLDGNESYAILRAGRYRHRPSQADQLHFDLWWRGENIACDPGTYLYSGDPPWNNGLASTSVHNTISLGERDQMTRAGRFLWLDWRDAEIVPNGDAVIATLHEYRSSGVSVRRSVLCMKEVDAWVVLDEVVGESVQPTRLQWLFPDYAWELSEGSLQLQTPAGAFRCSLVTPAEMNMSLVRGGEVVFGRAADCEIRGWRSLYYGHQQPALSLVIETVAPLPLRIVSVLAPADAKIGIRDQQVFVAERYAVSLAPALRVVPN